MMHGVNPDSIPRYAPPTPEPERKSCVDCDYYREVCQRQQSNGFVHCIGACVYELVMGETLRDRLLANPVEVDPDEPICTDFRDFK